MKKHLKLSEKLAYTIRHKRYYLKTELRLLGVNTPSGYLHDVDKLLLYLILPDKMVQKIHRLFNRHHEECIFGTDLTQMIIDCECARFTKKDKPLNARDTFTKYYPHLISRAEKHFKKLGL
jgi:hypothetical protein